MMGDGDFSAAGWSYVYAFFFLFGVLWIHFGWKLGCLDAWAFGLPTEQ